MLWIVIGGFLLWLAPQSVVPAHSGQLFLVGLVFIAGGIAEIIWKISDEISEDNKKRERRRRWAEEQEKRAPKRKPQPNEPPYALLSRNNQLVKAEPTWGNFLLMLLQMLGDIAWLIGSYVKEALVGMWNLLRGWWKAHR